MKCLGLPVPYSYQPTGECWYDQLDVFHKAHHVPSPAGYWRRVRAGGAFENTQHSPLACQRGHGGWGGKRTCEVSNKNTGFTGHQAVTPNKGCEGKARSCWSKISCHPLPLVHFLLPTIKVKVSSESLLQGARSSLCLLLREEWAPDGPHWEGLEERVSCREGH